MDADVIVTATGLQLQALGGIQLFIDGDEITSRLLDRATVPSGSCMYAIDVPEGTDRLKIDFETSEESASNRDVMSGTLRSSKTSTPRARPARTS